MNKSLLTTFILIIPFFLFAQESEQLGNAKTAVKDSMPAIAVIELFSSEGCSGCPPADDMVHDISIDAANNHLPVYVLEEDVDYLNNSGWVDVFGEKQFSERQQNYQKFFHDNGLFTPQIFINGIHEVYAANDAMANDAIDQALKEPALVTISVSVNQLNDSSAEMDYHLSAANKNWVINFALVQKNVASDITSGENKGLTLTHTNVVRQLITDPATIPDGIAQFNTMPKYAANTYSVIAFVQDKHTMKIIGAVQIDI